MVSKRVRTFFSALAVMLPAVLAADVTVNMDLRNTKVSPDGFERTGVIVNNQFPGTLIQANKNDTVHMPTFDNLDDPTMRRSATIHWHGFFQHRTATEDGPAFVTQCPISPGHNYTYQFPLNGQSGTYWYHSHLSSQYVDGLRGPFVSYDPDDPAKNLYDIDDEHTVITLADWYHNPAPPIEQTYLFGGHGFHEPIPDSGLINGVGRFKGGPAVPWARVNVTHGKRYRLRLINISAYAAFRFGIEGHSLTIIEVDGVNHHPLVVDQLDIYVAQRYSVIINANQTVGNYWISAPMTLQHASDNKNLDLELVHAVLHYDGAPDADPPQQPKGPSGELLLEHLLHPLNPPDIGGPADRVIDLNFQRNVVNNSELEWFINDISYKSPDLPTLLKVIANNATTEADFTRPEHTFVLQHNELVELQIHGSANGHVHPFHLHGHAFSVVQSRTGPRNEVDPPQRDVVGVGVGGGTVVIRFRADNPGPWFLHCHIDWHLEAGLAVVFAEAPNEMRQGPDSLIVRPEYLELCPIYDALPPELQ